MGAFQKFCEWSTDAKYVPLSRKCDMCGKKLGFFETGFWSTNAKQIPDGVLCSCCYEKLSVLAEYRTEWLKPKQRRTPLFDKLTVKGILQLRFEKAKQILEAAESLGREELALYGSEYRSVFRMRNAVFIEPTALQVGVNRAKILKNRLVVFGFVQLGQFKKGDKVLIIDGEKRRETTVLEAYVFDCEENTLEINLRANMGKQKIELWKTGWLVLDSTEMLNTDVTIVA